MTVGGAPDAKRPIELRLLIGFKVAKAVTWLVLAATLVIGLQVGLVDALKHDILALAAHASHAWAERLARWLVGETSRGHVELAVVGLVADAVLSAAEATALQLGHPWGEWLVVVSTGALLPFEVQSLAAHASPVRLGVLAVNVAVVAYLAGRIRRRRRAAKGP